MLNDEIRLLEVMSKQECLDLLPKVGIGRIGIAINQFPQIFPINFARSRDDIVFMTGPGTKLTSALLGRPVAFEVDYVSPMYHAGWSIVITGSCEEIIAPDELVEAKRLPLQPWAPGNRRHYVRIRNEEISGRRIAPISNNLFGANSSGESIQIQ